MDSQANVGWHGPIEPGRDFSPAEGPDELRLVSQDSGSSCPAETPEPARSKLGCITVAWLG